MKKMGISTMFGFGPADRTHEAEPLSPLRLTGIANSDARKLTYCHVLCSEDSKPSRGEIRRMWSFMEKQMALVPSGSVPVVPASLRPESVGPEGRQRQRLELFDVESFYVERTTVTNAEFAVFVHSGGYANMDLWTRVVWPFVPQFVDQTGKPGPRFWSDGRPSRDLLNHPVTGVCWYEADAYARWAGKAIPSPVQWQQAATWHTGGDGRYSMKMFPWGDLFDVRRANVWASGNGETVRVDKYYDGSTPNGVYQMVGNVWEWNDCGFVSDETPQEATGGLCEIRGGAFDTYFSRQASCQFRTGQPRLARTNNTGFRCVVKCSAIAHWPSAK
jgi:iron(II)-dependent oxidoreductase